MVGLLESGDSLIITYSGDKNNYGWGNDDRRRRELRKVQKREECEHLRQASTCGDVDAGQGSVSHVFCVKAAVDGGDVK